MGLLGEKKRCTAGRFAAVAAAVAFAGGGSGMTAQRPPTRPRAVAPAANDPRSDAAAHAAANFSTILYGAAYYNEYEPTDRLEEDIRLMKLAGLNVVRMGESTWSLWEPEDGHFEYAWMDRVVGAMSKAGIKVILGTPTYSIPTWMARAHPEIFAVGPDGKASTYGMRQNMDTDSPAFRFYAQRIIRNLVAHYRDNPDVIGWQVDNETGSNRANNPDVQIGFLNHLKQKFKTTDALNKAWLFNYWGENVNGWENFPFAKALPAPRISWSGPGGSRCAL